MAIRFLSGESVDGNITLPNITGRAIIIGGNTTLDNADASIYLGNSPSSYGFDITYKGTGSGNTNSLDIVSTNAGSPVTALSFTQDGVATFANNIITSSTSAVIQTPRISLEADGTLDWGQARDYGTLTWDTGYAVIKGQSSKGLYFNVNNNSTVLTLDTSNNATFAGDVTVLGGDITLGGTGRIQGIDTVSAGTDAANKSYVDTAVSGAGSGVYLPLSAGSSYPLTGDLWLDDNSGASPSLYLQNGSNNYWRLINGSTGILSLKEGTTDRLTFAAGGNATFAGDVSLVDDKKIRLGTGNDLDIYHNSTTGNSNIDNNTGDLFITNYTDDSDIIFRSDDGSGGVENYIQIDGSAGRTLFNKNIRVNDNVEIQVGGSADLKIYHEGTDSIIQNYTGSIYIDNNADDQDIVFRADDGSGGLATYFRVDGSEVETGFLKTTHHYDNVQARFGDAGDLRIYHNGSNSFISDTGTGLLVISSNHLQVYNAGISEFMITALENGAVNLYYDGSKKFETTNTGVSVTGDVFVSGGDITLSGTGRIQGVDTVSASTDAANKAYVDSAVAGSPQGTVTGSGTSTRVAFWSSGSALSSDGDLFWDNTNKYLGVGTSLPSNPLDVSGNFTLQGNQYMADNYQIILGNGSDLKIFHDGTDSRIQDSGNGLLKLQGSAVYLQHTTNGTTFTNMIEAISTYVKLNYSGSTKLETASNGVNITGLINISGDAYVQGGDIHMNSNINVISNSGSDVNLIIGDVANNDSIEQIDFVTFGQSQLTVFDDEVTMNASNVVLGSDTRFTTGNDSQIKYNATFSSSFKANGLFMPSGIGTSQSVTQGLLYALTSLGSWITVQNSSSNSTQLLAIAAGSNVLSGMLLQGVFKSASHGFAVGAPIYINSVSGTLTTTIPTAPGAYARVVGHAVDTNFILFNPDNTWVKLA